VPSFIASLLFLCAFIAAGWVVLPAASPGGGTRYFHAPAATLFPAPDGSMPVFILRGDRSPVRHGVARIEPGGLIRVDLYRQDQAEFRTMSQALLFDTGFSVLWAAASDRAHDELRQRVRRVQDEVVKSLERVMSDEIFTHEYRPVLRSILTDALGSAWQDRQAKAAFDNLMDAADPMLRDALRDDVGKILEARLEKAFWQFLKTNWSSPVYFITGDRVDYTPITEAIEGVLRDPRLQERMGAFGQKLIDTHEARVLAERLAIGVIGALLRDVRVPDVAGKMLWDPRFREEVRPLAEALDGLGAALPRDLGGLGSEHSLNPLAAQVFKALTLNRRAQLIMFVTPESRARIQQTDPDSAFALEPAPAP
jgi:hypothetical protein